MEQTITMPTGNVESVVRAARIIEYLANSDSDKKLVEIAQNVGLHVATTRRLLMTLLETGFVEKNNETKKYILGLKLLIIGKSYNSKLDIRLKQFSLRFLTELMQRSGETTNLVIEDKNEIIYLEQVECNNYLRIANKVGSRAPLYCTAAGKIILASRTLEEKKKYLESVSLLPLTSRTITGKNKFLLELERISEQRFAEDNEEQMIGERCLAVPVLNQNGKIIGAISISGPKARLDTNKINLLKPIIQEIGSRISEEIGFKKAVR